MPATAPPLPLTAAIDDFLVALPAGKPSPHTVRAYRADLDGVSTRLAEHLRGFHLEQIRAFHRRQAGSAIITTK